MAQKQHENARSGPPDAHSGGGSGGSGDTTMGRTGGGTFVFPRWTNRLREISAVVVIGGLLFVTIFITLVFSPETSAIGYAPEQPVPYSHALHVGELGMDCRYCHVGVESAAQATIPPTQTCMNCHELIKSDSEKLAPVRESFASGMPVPWVKVHDLPDFVYFNHSIHISSGVGCVSCHGRIDQMEVVRQDKALTMGWCLECHRDPEQNLRPVEFVTAMDWQPAGEAGEVGRRLREAHDIEPSTDCTTCHR